MILSEDRLAYIAKFIFLYFYIVTIEFIFYFINYYLMRILYYIFT